MYDEWVPKAMLVVTKTTYQESKIPLLSYRLVSCRYNFIFRLRMLEGHAISSRHRKECCQVQEDAGTVVVITPLFLTACPSCLSRTLLLSLTAENR
jgi:hypothetical protein